MSRFEATRRGGRASRTCRGVPRRLAAHVIRCVRGSQIRDSSRRPPRRLTAPQRLPLLQGEAAQAGAIAPWLQRRHWKRAFVAADFRFDPILRSRVVALGPTRARFPQKVLARRDMALGSRRCRVRARDRRDLVSARRSETLYASEGDLRIAYQVVGEGPLDLFFVTGGQFPVDLVWEEPACARFLRRLSSFSRMVLVDSRGWGASRTTTEAAPTFEAWADDLRLVMDTVGIERAAVVGWFASAVFSTYFAAAHPERVSSLVLLEGFARLLRDTDYPAVSPGTRSARGAVRTCGATGRVRISQSWLPAKSRTSRSNGGGRAASGLRTDR